MNRTKQSSGGFTIVELLIVIVIIGILAAIVIVGYSAVINNANDKSVQTDISKLADIVKLKNLDDQIVPVGGMTSSGVGTASTFSGITFKPTNLSSYDTTVTNLYYCEGTIGTTDEFGIVARSKSGNAFSYLSTQGVKSFGANVWTVATNGPAACAALGFTSPYTWSYGYNPASGYGWSAWAYNGDLATNLVTNPSMETSIAGWINYTGLNAPTAVTLNPWSGNARLSAVGLGTSTAPRVSIDVTSINPGDVLSISFRVRSDGQVPTNALAAIKNINGTSELTTFYTTTAAWSPDANGWVNVTGTFTVPSGGNGLRLSLGLQSAANYTGTLGIDGAILVKGSTIPNYADGNTPRWIWNGSTNLSTSTGPPA